jgi:hypothetical protein
MPTRATLPASMPTRAIEPNAHGTGLDLRSYWVFEVAG